MQISTKQVLIVLHIIAWVLFAALAVQAGAIIVNAVLMFIVDPEYHNRLWYEVNLQALFNYSREHFIVQVLFISIAAVCKTLIFYLLIKISNDNRFNLSQPFSEAGRRIIVRVSLLCMIIGISATAAGKHSKQLIANAVSMPALELQTIGGADVWIFMSIVLYVIAQVFKRGIEIQTENELTV